MFTHYYKTNIYLLTYEVLLVSLHHHAKNFFLHWGFYAFPSINTIKNILLMSQNMQCQL